MQTFDCAIGGAPVSRVVVLWCPCCFAGCVEIDAAEARGEEVETAEETCDDCRAHADGHETEETQS